MIDFHSHILPCIDDGSCSIDMTCKMLREEVSQNVDTVIASHHFYYQRTDMEEFFKKREIGLEITRQEIKSQGININVIPGAEVYLVPGIAEFDKLKELCIEGTNCIMIELPGNEWTGWVYNELYKLKNYGYIPILAHLERYSKILSDNTKILKLLEMEFVIQINTGDIGVFSYNKIIDKIVKSGRPVVLGTDSHNDKSRPVDFLKGYNAFKRRYGVSLAENIIETSKKVLMEDVF